MRHWILLSCELFLLSSGLMAKPVTIELGKWWKNSEIVRRLGISDEQVSRIEKSFLEHRPELARLNDDLKRQEAELKKLMENEWTNKTSKQSADLGVAEAIGRVATARAALEVASSSMLMDIRRALSWEQWETLEKIRNVEIDIIGGGAMIAPTPVRDPKPAYTDEARAAKINGIVVLDVLVHKDGSVSPLKVVQGLGYGLDESAINTVSQWKFTPGTRDGKPVDARATIEISFTLW